MLVIIPVWGQDVAISEFDLYGCWILERPKVDKREKEVKYVPCKDADSVLKVVNSKILLSAFNTGEFIGPRGYCSIPFEHRKDFAWDYDEKKHAVVVYENESIVKAMLGELPEIKKDLDSLGRLVERKFLVEKDISGRLLLMPIPSKVD